MSKFRLATWAHRIHNFGETPEDIHSHLDRLAEHGFDAIIPCIKNMPGTVDFRTDRADMTDACREWDMFGALVEGARCYFLPSV